MNNQQAIDHYKSYKKQYLLWVIISTLLLFITIFTISIIQIKQWKKSSDLAKLKLSRQEKVNRLFAQLAEQKKLLDEKKILEKAICKIKKYQSTDNNTISLVTRITNIIGKTSFIQDLEIHSKNIQMTLVCQTIEKGRSKIKRMQHECPKIKKLEISTINKKENALQFIVNGTLQI